MKINIFFLESDVDFSREYKKKLGKIIRETAKQAAEILDLKSSIINFTVYRFGKKSVFGYTQAKEWISITIPEKLDKEELRGIIYHEMNHIKRGYCGYTEKNISFLDTLFAEGLATVFEMEQIPERIPESAKYDKDFIKKWLPILKKKDLVFSRFSYGDWFLDQGEKPKLLGYKIGTYLIRSIQKNHSNLTIATLTKKKTSQLWKLAKENV